MAGLYNDYEVRPCQDCQLDERLLESRVVLLETGVSGEAIACAQHFKGLDAVLKRLPPKIIEIDGDGPRVADATRWAAATRAAARVLSACARRSRRRNLPARGMIRWWWGCITSTL